ncbi:MAG: carboxypeptidase regulatory-like domain-containing protein [Nannocystaceae bacterium]
MMPRAAAILVNHLAPSLARPDACSDANSDACSDANSDAHSDALHDAHSDALSDAHYDANYDAHSDALSDANSDAHYDANSDAHYDAHYDANSDANSDAHFDANSDANSLSPPLARASAGLIARSVAGLLALSVALSAGDASARSPGWDPPATATAAPTPAGAPTPTSSIQGVIIGHDDRRLAGVDVAVRCDCLTAPLQQRTGPDGVYRFEGLPPGRYTIEATIAGTPTQNVASVDPGVVLEADFILEAPAAPPPAPTPPPKPEPEHDHRHSVWGGVTVGLVFAPFRPAGTFSADASRITANQMNAWSGPIRGLDVRWQTFDLDRGRFPRTVGYFRSGYTQGAASFTGAGPGQATGLSYLTVPLFLGGNLYLFRDFPVRPYAGLGFGLDIMRLDFQRQGAGDYRDVSARIGFELHGGVEVRLTNHLAITGEVMQLWSARRRLGGLPDVSNESFTAILGLTGAFRMRDW